jgi:hypothetical protein
MADFLKVAVEIAVILLIVIVTWRILKPGTKYVRTRRGFREEFDEPPLDN